MQTIIIPVDFSAKTRNSIVLARNIAKKIESRIHLIHVIEPIAKNYAWLGDIDDSIPNDEFVVDLVGRLNGEMNLLKEDKSNKGFNITTEIKVGDPYQVVRQKIESIKPDLVIMGAKTMADAQGFLLGSITNKIIRSISYPVITVKEVLESCQFDNIVYATDLEEDHDTLVELLKQWQKAFNSTIHIAKINTRKNFHNDIDTKVALTKLAHKYALEDYTINSYSHEDEEYGIVYFADEMKADIIAMGVHEKSGLERLIGGGSLASEVTDHTFRPILTYAFK